MAEEQSVTQAVRAAFQGARERGGAGKAGEKPYAFKAISTNDTGVILGIGAAAENIDLDDEVMRKADLVRMSYDFCSASTRTFKANHKEEIGCDLVASWPGAPIFKSGKVLKAGDAIPADDPIIGINIEKGSETHWFVAVKPHDAEVLETAKKGGIAGFSWSGLVKKTPVKG